MTAVLFIYEGLAALLAAEKIRGVFMENNAKMRNTALMLQLFADGGGNAGAAASATGDNGNSVDAGPEARLLELGVPAGKIRKRANKYSPRTSNTAVQQPAKQNETVNATMEGNSTAQVAADAENGTEEKQPDKGKRLTWTEIMEDPEYNEQMQAVVRARLKADKQAQGVIDKLAPSMALLAKRYNLNPENIDYEQLNKAICDDDSYYEEKALEMGVDVGAAKSLLQKEAQDELQRKKQEQTLQEKKFREHVIGLKRQGEELKKIFPNFDLNKELNNPVFARMTAPNVGISLEDAYYAIHRKEIQEASMQATAQITAQKISNAIRTNGKRPNEAGTTGTAPSVTTFDYRKASKEQREALKQRIRDAAARGETIYPGTAW